MPRANRYFLPGHVWHITHRCHQKTFLLKFARDRRRYLRWVFEAKKRFGLAATGHRVGPVQGIDSAIKDCKIGAV
jgi:putative transposase